MEPTNTNCRFSIQENGSLKNKVLNYAKRFSTFCFLDDHQYQLPHHSVEFILAAGVHRSVQGQPGSSLEALRGFQQEKKSWAFGHIAYDLKNEIEALVSGHPDPIGFPLLYFFEPEILVRFSNGELEIEARDPQLIFDEISSLSSELDLRHSISIEVQQRYTKEEYLEVIKALQAHIHRGDCYEINFCQEFFANAHIDPIAVYAGLSKISPNPFSALYRLEDKWLICSSPERYIRKEGSHILSQPIKGTSKRQVNDPVKDEQSRLSLEKSEKDRSENVMVVDLVRNDLSKVCEDGTVKVDELFGIYSFPQVHQMISTISGQLKQGIDLADILSASFPMGSMTGAPKKKVMELIEQFERSRRGIFSGAVGYIDPNGDLDLNVVIRSIMYNASNEYLSYQVGSGITIYSDPEQEWEECLLKGVAMRAAVSGE